MKVVVIGGGVVGMSTAYALLKGGHEVCLLERNEDVGLETSFANGGQLSYHYVAPLADAGVPRQALLWMLRRDSPLQFSPRFSLKQWRWCIDFLKACRKSTNRRNAAHLLRLSLYSQAVLEKWRRDGGLKDFSWRRNGKLTIYRRRASFDKSTNGLSENGAQRNLSPSQCVDAEPALANIQHRLAGGILAQGDEVADCHLFCQRLLERAQQYEGFALRRGAAAEALQTQSGRISGVIVNGALETADHYVLAAGCSSPAITRPLGIKLPIYPLKGYSLSAQLKPDAIAPETNVTDYDHKTVFARIGNCLRIAAMVDISDENTHIPYYRIEAIRRLAEQNFPGAANYSAATEWAGCRPTTPQGTPILGKSGYENLWLNVGHGSLGFTLSCGSAEIINAYISGSAPEISQTGLTLFS